MCLSRLPLVTTSTSAMALSLRCRRTIKTPLVISSAIVTTQATALGVMPEALQRLRITSHQTFVQHPAPMQLV